MKTIDQFIDPLVQQYAENHTSEEDAVLKQINRTTHLKMLRPRMLSGSYQGKLLEFISCMVQPVQVLEIGTFVGYSAICLAKGLQPQGHLHTIEVDEELEEIILGNLELAAKKNNISLHIGKALEVIPTFSNNSFDLVFVDADKANYLNYYELVLEKTKKGGFILFDNILWSGKVLFDQPASDKESAILKSLNDFIQNDPRVENFLLPIRDGILIVKKL